jgi:hypothetical protein
MKSPSSPLVLPVLVVALRPQVQPSSCVDAHMRGSLENKKILATGFLVGAKGLEYHPPAGTPDLHIPYWGCFGGRKGTRTPDLLGVSEAL